MGEPVVTVILRAIGDWQIFGEIEDPAEHLTRLLAPWHLSDPSNENVVFETTNYIDTIEITYVDNSGPFGLCFVQFQMLVPIEEHKLKDAYEVIEKRLNEYVGDTDIKVRWLAYHGRE